MPQKVNNLQTYIKKAKEISPKAYLLLPLNLILTTSFICNDHSIHYLVGLITLVILALAAVNKVIAIVPLPDQLIDQSIIKAINELINKAVLYFDKLKKQSFQTKLIKVLIFVYLCSVLNTTAEIFLIVNFLYCSIFLKRQIEGCLCCQGSCCDMLSILKYKK